MLISYVTSLLLLNFRFIIADVIITAHFYLCFFFFFFFFDFSASTFCCTCNWRCGLPRRIYFSLTQHWKIRRDISIHFVVVQVGILQVDMFYRKNLPQAKSKWFQRWQIVSAFVLYSLPFSASNAQLICVCWHEMKKKDRTYVVHYIRTRQATTGQFSFVR